MARFGIYDDPADDEWARSWAHAVGAGLLPWTSGDVYLNYIGIEGAERVVAGLGADNLSRLAALKRSYDPDNLFHLNHNVVPTSG